MNKSLFTLTLLFTSLVSISQDNKQEITPEMLHDRVFVDRHSNNGIDLYGDYNNSGISDEIPFWKWADKAGGYGRSKIKNIAYTEEGNIIAAGSFCHEISIGNHTLNSQSIRDLFLMELDTAYNVLWIKQYKSSNLGESEMLDVKYFEGEIFIAGYFRGEQLELINSTINSAGEVTTFIACMDGSGSDQWFEEFPNSDDIVNTRSIGINDLNEIFFLSNNDYVSRIVKLDINGNVLLDNIYDTELYDIQVADDGILFGGCFMGSDATLGGLELSGGWNSNAVIALMHYSGEFEWAIVGSSNTPAGECYGGMFSGICIDDDQNIITLGRFNEGLDFGDGHDVYTEYNRSYFIMKITPSQEIEWIEILNSFYHYGKGYISSQENNIYAIASYSDSMTFYGSMLYGAEYFFANYNNEGQFIHAGNMNLIPSSLSIDTQGKLIGTGTLSLDACIEQISDTGTEEVVFETEGISGVSYSQNACLVKDHSGGILLTGYYHGDFVYRNIIRNTLTEALFILKTDHAGNPLWCTIIESDKLIRPAQINIDESDNIFLGGNFEGNIETEDSDLTTDIFTGFFTKLDPNGNLINIKKLADEGEMIIQNLLINQESNILISGNFSNTVSIGDDQYTSLGYTDVFLASFSNDLNTYNWSLHMGGDMTEYSGFISIDNNNNIYLAGEFLSEDIYFSNDYYVNFPLNEGNIIFLKLDPEGEVIYYKQFGGSDIPGEDYSTWPHAVQCDQNGNIFMIGWHGKHARFGDIVLPGEWGAMSYNSFVAMINPDGEVAWAESILRIRYGFVSWNIGIDNQGNCYFGGNYQDSVMFNNSIKFYSDDWSSFIVRYDHDGQFNWVRPVVCNYGGSYIEAVTVLDTNQLFATGSFNGLFHFDDILLKNYSKNSFLALSGSGTTGTKENSELLNITLSPNPAKDAFNVILPGSIDNQTSIGIYSLKGELVYEDTFRCYNNTISIKRGNMAEGIYLVKVSNKRYQGQAKLVLVGE